MESALKRDLRNYPLYFLIWTIAGIFFLSQSLSQKFFSRDPTPWWHYLISWLVGVYLWALLTPGILWLGRRYPFARSNWVRRGALHLLLGVAVSVVHLTLESAILSNLGIFPGLMNTFLTTFSFLLVIGFHAGILTYWVVLGLRYGISYYHDYHKREQEALKLELRASELQSQLVQAQLGVLKMQLQPHFLFNTLNAIMVLVRHQKSKEAEQTLAVLSDLLRCVLDDVEVQEVPLRRELEYLQLYLSIEQVRFRDRLCVEISIDPATLDAIVPQMFLQPVVENAIRHGLCKSAAAGTIKIGAARLNDTLEIYVQDDGPGFAEAGTIGKLIGIGLKNTRARLIQLYGEKASLSTANGEPCGAIVTISIPYHAVPNTFETEVTELYDLNDTYR